MNLTQDKTIMQRMQGRAAQVEQLLKDIIDDVEQLKSLGWDARGLLVYDSEAIGQPDVSNPAITLSPLYIKQRGPVVCKLEAWRSVYLEQELAKDKEPKTAN